MRYTYEHEETKVIFQGESGVDVIERLEHCEASGKYVVRVNKVAQLWYAIPTVAIARAKKYKPGNSFGFPANAMGRIC